MQYQQRQYRTDAMFILYVFLIIFFIASVLSILKGEESILSDLYFSNKEMYISLFGKDSYYGIHIKKTSLLGEKRKKFHKMVISGVIGNKSQKWWYQLNIVLTKLLVFLVLVSVLIALSLAVYIWIKGGATL